jgi:hypothetical protein
MMAMTAHEVRMFGRRAAWPALLLLHALAAALFVGAWGPTGGIPLWRASALDQFVFVERLAAAMFVTWVGTSVLTDDQTGSRSLTDWAALTGRNARAVFQSRILASVVLTLVLVTTGAPGFVAAAESSAAAAGVALTQVAAVYGFALLCLGVTAVIALALRDRVAIWCVAMIVCLVAAAATRSLETTILRAAVPAAAGLLMLVIAPAIMREKAPA